jgi:hypothetical protein
MSVKVRYLACFVASLLLFALASPCLAQQCYGITPGLIKLNYEPIGDLSALNPAELGGMTKPMQTVGEIKEMPLQRTGQYLELEQKLFDLQTYVGDKAPCNLESAKKPLHNIMSYMTDKPVDDLQTEAKPLDVLGLEKKPLLELPAKPVSSFYQTREPNVVDKYFRQKSLMQLGTKMKPTYSVPSTVVK